MRTQLFPRVSGIASIFAALVSSLVSAQAQTPSASADGLFHFTTAQSQQSLQEAATILRTVANLPQVSIDIQQSTLTFHGPSEQVAMGQWMMAQLDTKGNEGAALQYTSPVGNDVVRVNFLTHTTGPQQMQEALTMLRTVADIARIFNFTARQAIVIRAKSADMVFAEWIVDQLNIPAGGKLDATPRAYPGATTSGYVARFNYLTNISGPQAIQQALTVLRTVGDIRKIFNYSSLPALAMRGPETDIDRAEWMLQELNQPPGPNAGTQVYQTPGADDLTRIFFLTNATDQGMAAALTAIRTGTTVRKAFYMTKPAAIVVRGTADQNEAAVQIMAQRNGLAD